MRRYTFYPLPYRVTAFLLSLCMVISMINSGSAGLMTAHAASRSGPTDVTTREADPNTMETYVGKLLSGVYMGAETPTTAGGSNETFGSRYAGRVWTDKSVVAYNEKKPNENKLTLTMDLDGYDGSVGFNADFLHIYSALTSSQVVNEYPPTPIDLVIVFDMSGSMGQDIRYGIDAGGNTYQGHNTSGDSAEHEWPEEGVLMSDRIKNSRVQATLTAINATIDRLMEQNPQNRVAVCGYGANAVVLMPLAHYRHTKDSIGEDIPYLSVGGMETLYHPSDLVYRTTAEEGVEEDGWYWMNNRDTCYTVVVNGGNESNTYTGPLSDTNPDNDWKKMQRYTVSNNVRDNLGNSVKAFPGDWNNDGTEPLATYEEASKKVYVGASTSDPDFSHGEAAKAPGGFVDTIKETTQLEANDYVGYFTNTQGGIYLAYKQLADSEATTYAEKLTNGQLSTVARIPAAIIMSDGGANFAFNEMGPNDGRDYAAKDWYVRYGQKKTDAPASPSDATNYYMDDNNWGAASSTYNDSYVDGHNMDYKHHFGVSGSVETSDYQTGNLGDEWYNVYLPGKKTLGEGWDGLHGMYNLGADCYKDGTLSSQPAWNHAGVLYSSDNSLAGTAGTTLEVLLTASYMNEVVKEHYANGWSKNNATESSRVQLSTFTMNVDTKHVPQWGRWRLYPTLNPKEYSLDFAAPTDKDTWSNDKKKFGETFGGTEWGSNGNTYHDLVFAGLSATWKTLKEGGSADAAMADPTGDPRIRINPISEGGSTYLAGDKDTVTITNKEVIDNIAYNDKFYDVESEKLSEIFDEILTLILGKVFVPVSGDNDAGVGDSITYQDPIGLYMEIKNGAIQAKPHHRVGPGVTESEQIYDMAMLLFGEVHGLVRAGVYDYKWSDEYISKINSNPNPPEGKDTSAWKAGETNLPIGWYKGDAANAEYSYDANGLPKGYTSAADAWADGWVLRLDSKTLSQYVPITGMTEESTPGDLPAQVQNTVYTLYRFSCPSDDRNTLRINPVYGDTVPMDIQKLWDEAKEQLGGQYPVDDTIYKDSPGVYRLSDIRVWMEETGDFVDTEGALSPNKGYSDSLYVNLPAAAIPTQLAEITMGKDGVLSYRTNLGDDHKEDSKDKDKNGNEVTVGKELHENYCIQSTPFRLFYAVGVEEDLILRDEKGDQTGINVAALLDDYVATHTENGRVYFYSNYYSGTTYSGFGSDQEGSYRTIGDPTVSFSSSSDNRYYVFQKPLPLYAHAYRVNSSGQLEPVDREDGQIWTKEENQTGGNGTKTWEDGQTGGGTWAGGRFMGVYENQEDYTKKREKAEVVGSEFYITDANNVKYKVVEGGIVFLKQDLLEHVTSGEGGGYDEKSVAFNSDDYFFLPIEFYLPDTESLGRNLENQEVPGTFGGEAIQYVVSRKGSAFGSGLHAEQIGNGDMLCWTDVGTGLGLTLEYSSRTTTGDDTRGEPTYQKLFPNNTDELREYLRDTCHLSDKAEGGETSSPLEQAVKYWTDIQTEWKDVLLQADKKENKGNGDGKVDIDEYNNYFHWAVATKPGGLRLGDMFQNMQAKWGELVGSYYTENVTHTANNFYVPTISSNSSIDDIIINNYLGNNGRLYVSNSQLYVAKTIDTEGIKDDPNYDSLIKTRFNYQVYIAGQTGQMDAILLRWNRWGNEGKGTWQRQLDYIDVKTSNEGLLQDSDNNKSVFCLIGGKLVHLKEVSDAGGVRYYRYGDVDANGQPSEGAKEVTASEADKGTFYYVYVGGDLAESGDGSSEYVRRLFKSKLDEDTLVDGSIADAGRTVYMNTSDVPASRTDGSYWSVYQKSSESLGSESSGEPSGSIDYWFRDVYLIPRDEVDAATIQAVPGSYSAVFSGDGIYPIASNSLEGGGWSFDSGKDYIQLKYDGREKPDYDAGTPFLIAHMEQHTDDSDVTISSEYVLNTKFLTRTVYFGQKVKAAEDTEHKGNWNYVPSGAALTEDDLFDQRPMSNANLEKIAEHTAQFTLGHEEGLLFPGLDSATVYRITEQDAEGFKLEKAVHTQERGGTTYVPDSTAGSGAKPESGNNAATADFHDGRYSLDGDTSASVEEGGWYVNGYAPGSLSVTKGLEAEGGTEINGQDRQQLFDFTLSLTPPKLASPSELTVSGPFSYAVWGGAGSTVKRGRLLPETMKGEAKENDIVADSSGTWKFSLQGGQTMTVDGLPLKTGYTYTASEAPSAGYEATGGKEGESGGTTSTVTGEVQAGDEEPVRVVFTNTKKKPEPVEVDLELTKKLNVAGTFGTEPEIKEGAYVFRVVPSGENPEDDPISGIAWDSGRAVGWNGSALIVKNEAPEGDGQTAKATVFEDLPFEESGVYVYYVTEQISGEPGVSSDSAAYTVTVNVKEKYEDGLYTGKLTADIKVTRNGASASPEGILFTNTMKEGEVSVPLRARKEFNGTLTEGMFTFQLTGDAAYAPTATPGDASREESPLPPEATPANARRGSPVLPSEAASANARRYGSGLPSEATPGNARRSSSGLSSEAAPGNARQSSSGLPSEAAPGNARQSSSGLSSEAAPGNMRRYSSGLPSEATPGNADKENCGGTVPLSRNLPAPQYVLMSSAEPGKWEQSNTADGWIHFGTITFTAAGTYVYELREVVPDEGDDPAGKGSIRYSSAVYRITFEIAADFENAKLLKVENVSYEISENGDGVWTPWDGSTLDVPVFINEAQTGGLRVAKEVTGTGEKTKEFHFTVTFDSDGGLDGVTVTKNGQPSDLKVEDGKLEFTLRDGEYMEAEGLPVGTAYTVTEAEAGKDGYTTTITETEDGAEENTATGTQTGTQTGTGAGGNTSAPDDDGAAGDGSGTIRPGATDEVKFVNDKPTPQPEEHYGDLNVTKTVSGSGGDPEREWHFRVELSDTEISGRYGDMVFADGAAEFTLKHGQSAVAQRLPAGITYTVTETEADQDGYTTEASGASGTIPDGDAAEARFTNSKEPPTPEKPPENPPDNPPDRPSYTPPGNPSYNPPDNPTPAQPEQPSTAPPYDTPYIPVDNSPEEIPMTGDNKRIGLWLGLLALSLIGIIATSLPLMGRWRRNGGRDRAERK